MRLRIIWVGWAIGVLLPLCAADISGVAVNRGNSAPLESSKKPLKKTTVYKSSLLGRSFSVSRQLQSEDNDDEEEIEEIIIEAYISFFLFSFLSSAALQWLVSHITVYTIPVSVIWFIYGMVTMLVVWSLYPTTTYASPLLVLGITSASSMDGQIVYLIFLPILLYEECLNINWHKFKRFCTSGICLAVLGVAFQCAVVGILCRLTFMPRNDITWTDSLMLGAAMASTDPVAVISVLNSVQAPEKLATMFDGEALINDGTSVLFFQLFKSMSRGDDTTWSDVLLRFFLLLFVSPIWGTAVGVFVYMWIRRFRKFGDVQVLTLITGGYLVYFVGEHYLNVSGPIAIVSYGLFYTAFAHIGLNHETQEHHHHSVRAIGIFANSSIFIIAGIVAARMIIESLNANSGAYDSTVRNIPLLYIYLLLARSTMILIFQPVLKRTGYGVNWKELTLLIWGGLRGAIVLALGLMIEQDHKLPEKTRSTLVLYIAANTLLILLINGVSFEYLFTLLNPYPPKPFRRVYFELVMKLIDEEYEAEKLVLKNYWLFRGTSVLDHASKVVPKLGWRKMDKRGKIDFKLPNVFMNWNNLPKCYTEWRPPTPEIAGIYNALSNQKRFQRRTRTYGNLGQANTDEALGRESGNKDSMEKRAHDTVVSVFGIREAHETGGTFDPEKYLLLVDQDEINKKNPSPAASQTSTMSKDQPKKIHWESEVPQKSSHPARSVNVDRCSTLPTIPPIIEATENNFSDISDDDDVQDDPVNPAESKDQAPPGDFDFGLPCRILSEPFGSNRLNDARMTRLRQPEWDRRAISKNMRQASVDNLMLGSCNTASLHRPLDYQSFHSKSQSRPYGGAIFDEEEFAEVVVSPQHVRGSEGYPSVLPHEVATTKGRDTTARGRHHPDGITFTGSKPPPVTSPSMMRQLRHMTSSQTAYTNLHRSIFTAYNKLEARGRKREGKLMGKKTARGGGLKVPFQEASNPKKSSRNRSQIFSRISGSILPARMISAPPGKNFDVGNNDEESYDDDDDSDNASQYRSPSGHNIIDLQKLIKEREGELYVMTFNAMRQMYQKLFRQSFIGGSALLLLNASLDESTDYAIGKFNKYSPEAWKSVASESPDFPIQLLTEGTTNENFTGFEFEWRCLISKLKGLNRYRRRIAQKKSTDATFYESMIALPSAVLDLQLITAFVDVHEELLYKGGRSLKFLLGPKLLASFQRQISHAKYFIVVLMRCYPNSFVYSLTAHAATLLINLKQMLLEEQAQKGLIQPEDCEAILHLFEEQRQNIASFMSFRWQISFAWIANVHTYLCGACVCRKRSAKPASQFELPTLSTNNSTNPSVTQISPDKPSVNQV